jgi:aconitate hydratase
MERDMLLNIVEKRYEIIKENIDKIRKNLKKPLTLTEKILYSHLFELQVKEYVRGKDYIELLPDRVAMQDATAQMALLQFIMVNRDETFVPASIHCDHLIEAENGEKEDLKRALEINKEVYDFLSSVALKYGIDYWKPGYGIIHQVIFENYAFPGGLIIGTDSHTPTAGGLGMLGVGVGGSDAVDAMVGLPWELKFPKITGVKLTGKLSGWASPKDVILKLLGILSVKGGTGHVIEYFGEGAKTISATGKATICNMGAELGATSSIFPFDQKMYEYLVATGRKEIAQMAIELEAQLSPDREVLENPEKYYDRVIEINLSELKPHINGPFSPDVAHTVENIGPFLKENDYPVEVSACLIGSCTNSSYEDLDKVASVAREALEKRLKLKAKLFISPGSQLLKDTIENFGQLETLKKLGAIILANACGPCIGMWKRNDIKTGEKNTIVTSFNRNFAKRADGNPQTHAFLSSPEMVMAFALAGRIDFNPETDFLVNEDNEKIKLSVPSGKELPEKFIEKEKGILKTDVDRKNIEIKISENSERLAFLVPFEKWDGKDFIDLPVLVKIKGKCTTDHISMAGEWLKYRGHLDKISNNLFLGVTNAFTGEIGKTKDIFTKEYKSIPEVARNYKNKGISWVVIADENYGEGSSREHAAMEPRYLGCKAIVAKSFARIHETNLKKQGILALTFINPGDYDRIKEDDRVSIYLSEFVSGRTIFMDIKHSDGSTERIELSHSYNEKQIEWFKAGSALNLIARGS